MTTFEIGNQVFAESSNTFVQTKPCMIAPCAECSGSVELVSGAIIFGDKWYHNKCWKSRRERNVR